MDKNHRQGRQEAGASALQRAHAQKLIRTLITVCRQLGRSQADPVARRAYREVERRLREMNQPRRAPAVRRRGKFKKS